MIKLNVLTDFFPDLFSQSDIHTVYLFYLSDMALFRATVCTVNGADVIEYLFI